MRLDIDRGFAFALESLSTCDGSSLNRPSEQTGDRDAPEKVRARCRSAIVAEGEAEFVLSYPENTPIPIFSDLTLFKRGTRDGVTNLFLHAYLTIPTPHAIVIPAELKRIRNGRYGTRLTISLPKIASGYGRLNSFSLTFPRRAPHPKKPFGVAKLRCADGRAQIQAESIFNDGVRTTSTAIRTCATAPEP